MADKSPPRQWPGADDDAEKGAPEMVETIPTPKKDGPVLPRDWPSWKKNVTVALVSALNFLVNMSATMPSPGLSDMMAEFNMTSRPLATFAVSVYILGLALGPMVLAPLSEIYGRLPLYRWTNAGFVYFTALGGIAWTFPLLVVLRFLQGCVASVPIVIGGATIADLFPPATRGQATSWVFFSAMLGPPLGPVAGAFLSQYLGWRWTFGMTAIMGVLLSILSLLFLGETHEKTVIRKYREAARQGELDGGTSTQDHRRCGMRSWGRWKKKKKNEVTVNVGSPEMLRTALVRPIKLLLFERALLLLGLYQALSYGYIVLLLTSFSSVFTGQYGFSTSMSGLPYLGLAVGFGVGVVISALVSDRLAARLARQRSSNNGSSSSSSSSSRRPEDRLPLMAWSCWVIPTALALYGWTAFHRLPFPVPLAAAGLAALGLQLLMLNAQVYLSEAHAGCVPSALAAVTLLRCLVGSTLPVAGASLYARLGLGWGNSLLALLGVVMMPVPWIVMMCYRTDPKTAHMSTHTGST